MLDSYIFNLNTILVYLCDTNANIEIYMAKTHMLGMTIEDDNFDTSMPRHVDHMQP